jgi:hypothetical protein
LLCSSLVARFRTHWKKMSFFVKQPGNWELELFMLLDFLFYSRMPLRFTWKGCHPWQL